MCSSILESVLCGAGVAQRARAGWVGVQVEVAVDVFLWCCSSGLRGLGFVSAAGALARDGVQAVTGRG